MTTQNFANFYSSLKTDERKRKFRNLLFSKGQITEPRIYGWLRRSKDNVSIDPIIANFVSQIASELDPENTVKFL